MSTFDRQLWVRSLLSELGLTKCEHTRLSSLSGGERKRLSLAVQVINDVLTQQYSYLYLKVYILSFIFGGYILVGLYVRLWS
jgi:ABC-type hemin transport system ATPase subunit